MGIKEIYIKNSNGNIWLNNDEEVYLKVEEIWGLLYNGYVLEHANFPLTNWSIPTHAQWETIASGYENTGSPLKLVGNDHWNDNSDATNTTGFNGPGCGAVSPSSGSIQNFRDWSSISLLPLYNNICGRVLFSDSPNCNYLNNGSGDVYYRTGLSARFIYSGSGDPGTIYDYDGNAYNTALIDGNYWTTENWKCTHLNNGTDLTLVNEDTWSTAESGDLYYRNPLIH